MVTQPYFLQLNLFGIDQTKEPVPLVTGLQYISNFISPDEQQKLLQEVDAQPWSQELKRRVQHYGYRYDYKSRSVAPSMYLGALPDWAGEIVKRITLENCLNILPDQVIVNEYQPGQGISQHIDCESCFTDTIISLSLGSSCIMDFSQKLKKEKKSLFLEPGSLLVLKDAARYEWQHGIPQRKTDLWQGNKIPRERRVSLTFRKVIL
ncbi:MAG: alpha-ketoglutarate-dependent dioxygenase AlkB [Aphanothece sp. CMT-3BRIN-NPC111]|jgi:alkylated DNA repair dioxygenase AlkB|nr:alpha-ketoglutarate-dependent dioxygenase AlkB [Aphanothece sp. CMT-3BRIN-NPC111]